jgi:sialidase-1
MNKLENIKIKNYILLLFLFISFGANAQKEDYNKSLNFKNLFGSGMKEGVSCYRIPALVTATNGDLIVAIDERVPSCGDLKWSKDINIAIRRSEDNGTTWSDIEIIVDFPFGQSASDPSMIVDKVTNEIFMFYNFMNLEKEKDIYYLHVIKSTDHGKTWSAPTDITSQITKPEWHKDFKFITSGRGIQTRSGKLLHCIVNLESDLHLFGSDDHGKSWFLLNTPIKDGNESKVVELTNGSWMVNSRINEGGIRYSHISTDKGKTWKTKEEPTLVDPGCNASIIRFTSIEDGYKKNRLLFSNANNKDQRKNMTIKLSYDEGKTWTNGKTIYEGGSAYSSLTVLKNEEIGLFFEKDDHKENVFVSMSLDWLTDGKDKLEKPSKN